jgi:hypothetical protein
MEPSPCLLLPRLLATSHRLPFFFSPKTSHLTRTLCLRLPAATHGAGEEESDDGFIQIARCYEAPLARLDLSGAVVMRAFLPAADDDRSVASTRLVWNFELYSPIIRHTTFYSNHALL